MRKKPTGPMLPGKPRKPGSGPLQPGRPRKPGQGPMQPARTPEMQARHRKNQAAQNARRGRRAGY